MKALKKYSGILLAFICTFILCIPVYAKDKVYVNDYFQYTVADESVTIVNYYGKDSEVTVPSMIAGNPVNTIAAGAFSGNDKVTKVNLPDTIMTIEEKAFSGSQTVVFDSNTDHPDERKPSGTESGSGTSSNNEKKNTTGSQSSSDSNSSKDNNSASSTEADKSTASGTDKSSGENGGVDVQEADLEDAPSVDESGKNGTGKPESESADKKNAKEQEGKSKKSQTAAVVIVVIILLAAVAFLFVKKKKDEE